MGKPPDDGQRNCPKHVEFYSENKFEKSVHLVGFIVRVYHDARSPERQNQPPALWFTFAFPEMQNILRIYKYAVFSGPRDAALIS